MAHRLAYIPSSTIPLVLAWVLGLFLCDPSAASSLVGSPATTEPSCNFWMAKGQATQSCQVPVPQGCIVANFPGTDRPWSDISKGGVTTCRFNDQETDWKTRITGTCERCKSGQCSAHFSVKLNCAQGK
jgi:hypothetical protein